MIVEITKTEYERLKTKQKLHDGFIDCLPFAGIDKKYYKCQEKGMIGAKQIWEFQRELKRKREAAEKERQTLQLLDYKIE